MPAAAKRKMIPHDGSQPIEYRGKQTKTGNSSGFRFEGALFKSHPEFNGDVTAHVIAPGRLLVTAEPKGKVEPDPVMASFLAFLGQDIARSPKAIEQLDPTLAERIDSLVDGMEVDSDTALSDVVSL